MAIIPPVTNIDQSRIPVEGSQTFRQDASYVWSALPQTITSMNTAIGVMNSTNEDINNKQILASTSNYKGVYDSATVYGLFETVSDSYGNNFISLVAGNVGNALSDATKWQVGLNTLNTGMKNLIINGGFDVWQRGTSGTVTDGYVGPDRWNFTYGNTSITQTISQLSELIPGVSCRYQVRVECTTPADNVYMQYKFENSVGKDSAGNFKTLTLSFWARSIRTTQQTLTLLTTSEVIAVPLTTTWTKYIYVLNAVDNVIAFKYQQNSTIDFAMTQVQLEPGSVATPFENRPYGLELSLCQRYYEELTNPSLATAFNTTRMDMNLQFKVPKRNTSYSVINTSYGYLGGNRVYIAGNSYDASGAWTKNVPQLDSCQLANNTYSGITAGDVGFTDGTVIAIDNEL